MSLFSWMRNKKKDGKEFAKKISNVEEITKVSKEIKEMSATLLSPKKIIEKAKTETFLEAKSRLQLNDVDLIKNYQNYVYCFYISVFFSFFCFTFTLYKLFFKQEIFAAIAVLAFFVFSLANAFKFSFRAFQIKHQKLCSVSEWFERSNEWWPKL